MLHPGSSKVWDNKYAQDGRGRAMYVQPKIREYPRQSLRDTEAIVDGRSFTESLTKLINKFSEENDSNTPDFILSNYMRNYLDAFNIATQQRAEFFYKV
jgi:hypothetical protein